MRYSDYPYVQEMCFKIQSGCMKPQTELNLRYIYSRVPPIHIYLNLVSFSSYTYIF